MAKGDGLTVGWYIVEAVIRAWETRNEKDMEAVIAQLGAVGGSL